MVTFLGFTVAAFLVTANVSFSFQSAGNFALMLGVAIVFVFPSAFMVPHRKLELGMLMAMVVGIIGIVVTAMQGEVTDDYVADLLLVVSFSVIAVIAQQIQDSASKRIRLLFAAVEAESHTQLVLLQRVIPRVFLPELLTN